VSERSSTSDSASALAATSPTPRRRGDALLSATYRFFRCEDVDALAVAILDTLDSVFGATKAAIVLVGADGALRLETTRGYSDADLERSSAAVRDVSPFVLLVGTDEEVWSDDDRDEALQQQLAAYASVASFSLPIGTEAGVVGNVTAMFETDRAFDAGDRAAARQLASQVGLALEVLDTRARLRDEAQQAERERRQAAVLLRVAHELAAATDPTQIPPILAVAIREASQAAFAAVGRMLPAGKGFEFIAGSGLTPAQEALFLKGPATPESYPLAAEILAGKPVSGSTLSSPSGMAEVGMGSFSAAPIVIDGNVWGLVGLGANDEPALATGWWADLATGFASIAATALARSEAVAALARQRDLLASAVAERTLHLTTAVEELQRASEAKTAFLANVSHELRTPLTAILGFVEILATGLDGPLNQAQLEDVATVQASSRHLLTLIDDLIDVASIEGGRLQLSLGPVAIGELVRENVETMRPLAGEKGISLEVESVQPDLLATADRLRLREIVLNLLSNPLKFTPSQGRVRVSALAEPATGLRPAMIRIDVRDSGIGVSEADRDRIFEKFAQTAGPKYVGTGLGLSISRELARLHGGDLIVESTLGIGSTFSVHVPVALPDAAAAHIGSLS